MLVEDNPKDVKRAAEIARAAGFQIVDAHASLIPATTYVDSGLKGFRSLPDVIVLDLNLGYDSGFELLRFWHSTPRLNAIPLIVWSVMGDEQRENCELFKVIKVVAKWEGDEVLRDALSSLRHISSSSSALMPRVLRRTRSPHSSPGHRVWHQSATATCRPDRDKAGARRSQAMWSDGKVFAQSGRW